MGVKFHTSSANGSHRPIHQSKFTFDFRRNIPKAEAGGGRGRKKKSNSAPNSILRQFGQKFETTTSAARGGTRSTRLPIKWFNSNTLSPTCSTSHKSLNFHHRSRAVNINKKTETFRPTDQEKRTTSAHFLVNKWPPEQMKSYSAPTRKNGRAVAFSFFLRLPTWQTSRPTSRDPTRFNTHTTIRGSFRHTGERRRGNVSNESQGSNLNFRYVLVK